MAWKEEYGSKQVDWLAGEVRKFSQVWYPQTSQLPTKKQIITHKIGAQMRTNSNSPELKRKRKRKRKQQFRLINCII